MLVVVYELYNSLIINRTGIIMAANQDDINFHKFGSLPLFNLGFRCFFLGAGVYAIFSIVAWAALYFYQIPMNDYLITPFQWHAHEMIYGYGMAVIAGFLLTAVKNWTGIQTLQGRPLIVLFGLWLIARLLFISGASGVLAAGLFDILFSLVLIYALAGPIIKTKQWTQVAILSKVILLVVFNLLFYLGALDVIDRGAYLGTYGGLYLLVGLILTMGRRVLPFFIEKGVDYPVKLFNSRILDLSSLFLFVAFFVSELFFVNPGFSAYLALGLFAVSAIRLIGWHTPGIWHKSLLWSLYLAAWFICFGFLLIAGVYFFRLSGLPGIHALAYGGVGLITLSMMTRVTLGHTGRDVSRPPLYMAYAFAVLIVGALIRVLMPMIAPSAYAFWIGLSQLLWAGAFLIFSIKLIPMLVKPRVDGALG